MSKLAQYHFSTLAENPQLFEEVIALVEKEFHYTHEYSYLDDFYLLMNPLNFENCLIAIDTNTNTVAAHVAFCKRELIKGTHTLPIVMIGGIATNAQYKKQGLFRELMNQVIAKNKNSTALYMLWSEITGLYEKFNFYLSGGLIQTGNSFFDETKKPVGFYKHTFKDLSNSDFNQILKLHQISVEQKVFAPKRTKNEWALIKDLKSVDLYLKKDEDNQIVQYFMINKGRDLNNIVHEFGALENYYKDLVRLLKPYKTWMCETHKPLLNNYETFFNAYIKIGNIQKLNQFLENVSGQELKIDSMVDDVIHFSYRNQPLNLTQHEFLVGLFGPNIIEEFSHYQLSPYIPGIDSV